MEENKKFKWVDIIYFGAIWGILEATLGYFLHFIPTFVAGMVMFPIAATILLRAYQKLQSKSALLGIGLIAALIKAVNLPFSPFSIWKTINPMAAIVFESLMVVAVVALVVRPKRITQLIALPLASVGWRGLYLAYMGIQFALTGFLADHLANIHVAIEFAVVGGILSGVVAYVLYFGTRNAKIGVLPSTQLRPVLAISILLFAVAATIFFGSVLPILIT